MKPDLAQSIEKKQNKKIEYEELKCHDRLFSENYIVRVRNTQASGNKVKWIIGKVVKICGPRTYLVRTRHKTRFVHADHLIRAHDKLPEETDEVEVPVLELSDQSTSVTETTPFRNSSSQQSVVLTDQWVEPSLGHENVNTPSPPPLRRSVRNRKPVYRLNL